MIVTSRNLKECEKAKCKLIEETGNTNIIVKALDFDTLYNIRSFAKDILKTEERLDILINNAGSSGTGRKYSSHAILQLIQINYLEAFLLTNLLLDLIKKSKPSRIVNVASNFSQMGVLNLNNINKCPGPIFSELLVYCTSKLFTVYMTWELAARLKDSEILVNCVHTGYVATDIWSKTKLYTYLSLLVKNAFFKTPEQGAQTPIHAAVSEDVEGITGKYFDECKPYRPFIHKDLNTIRKVWDKSIELVNLKPEEIKI